MISRCTGKRAILSTKFFYVSLMFAMSKMQVPFLTRFSTEKHLLSVRPTSVAFATLFSALRVLQKEHEHAGKAVQRVAQTYSELISVVRGHPSNPSTYMTIIIALLLSSFANAAANASAAFVAVRCAHISLCMQDEIEEVINFLQEEDRPETPAGAAWA